MKIQTERLLLSSVSLSDVQAVHQLHSMPETDEFNTLGIPGSIAVTENLVSEWLKQQEAQPQLSYVFCITLPGTGEFAGLIGLKMGKPNYRIAEVWYKIHPLHWGKGFATEGVLALLNFGFRILQLHRIEAGCAVGNLASIRVLEKAGMTREGRKRAILPIRGEWVDNYFYAILENEYK